MKKAIRQILSIALAVMLTIGMTAFFAVSADEAKVVVYNDCSDIDMLTGGQRSQAWNEGAEIVTGYANSTEGRSSFKSQIGEECTPFGSIFHYMLLIDSEQPVDLNEYPFFEMFVKTKSSSTISGQFQVNFANQNTTGAEEGWGEDGKNYTWNRDFGADSGWERITIDALNAGYTVPVPEYYPDLANKVDRMRISLIGPAANNFIPANTELYIDGLIYYNQAFLDERTAAETAMAEKIAAAVVPTADNFESVKESTIELISGFNAKYDEYPNFRPSNYDKFVEIYTAYYGFVKDDMVSAAKDAIDAIGEITVDNHAEKSAAIDAVNALIEELTLIYGEDGYTLDNASVVKEAEKTIRYCEKAATVVDAIKALPAADVMTLENKTAVEDARKAYDKLSDRYKEYVPESYIAVLEAAEAKIYELENPYTLGNVDEDEEDKVTASDALLALQAAVKKIELSDLQNKAAEVDGKEGITAGDALCILQYAVGKITSFPIEQA